MMSSNRAAAKMNRQERTLGSAKWETESEFVNQTPGGGRGQTKFEQQETKTHQKTGLASQI
jgi:type IV secretory pathway TraG/TraD family ATPase VirD4